MAVRLTAAWRPFDHAQVARLAAHMGVYQLGDDTGGVVSIGFAGGASRFGLRGELETALAARQSHQTQFRFEITTAYHSRYRELLQVHLHDHGELPAGNSDMDAAALGRIRPD